MRLHCPYAVDNFGPGCWYELGRFQWHQSIKPTQNFTIIKLICASPMKQCFSLKSVLIDMVFLAARDPSTPSTGNVHCIFPAARDILIVMLNREIILFDIEFGQPIYSFRLPNSYTPFLKILGVSGQGVSVGGGIDGGIDDIHCMHEVRNEHQEFCSLKGLLIQPIGGFWLLSVCSELENSQKSYYILCAK